MFCLTHQPAVIIPSVTSLKNKDEMICKRLVTVCDMLSIEAPSRKNMSNLANTAPQLLV